MNRLDRLVVLRVGLTLLAIVALPVQARVTLQVQTTASSDALVAIETLLAEFRKARTGIPMVMDLAREYLARAIPLHDRWLVPDDDRAGRALSGLGSLARSAQDHETAARFYEEAARVQLRVFGPEHATVRSTFGSLAESLETMADKLVGAGEDDHAVPLLERALPARERSGWIPSLGLTQDKLAHALAATGNRTRALAMAIESQATRSRDGLLAASQSERSLVAMASTSRRSWSLALTLAAGSNRQSIADVWQWTARGRSPALELIATRRRIAAASTDGGTATRWTTLTSLRDALGALLVRGPAGRSTTEYETALYQARIAKDEAERALAKGLVEAKINPAFPTPTFAEIAAALPAESALVGYVTYDHLDWSRGRVPRIGRTPSYLAFVVRRGATSSAPALVPLGPAAPIEAAVERVRDQIVQPAAASVGLARLEASYRAVGRTLRELVWDPLAPQLQGARRIFVVPDGQLQLIDFSALPVGQSRYLLDSGAALHYLSTERDLLSSAPIRQGEGVLAMGAPAFGARSGLIRTPGGATAANRGVSTRPRPPCIDLGAIQFDALPAAAREAQEVATAWSRAAPGQTPTVLIGAAATEDAFKGLAPRHRILHLATHGFFLGEPCASLFDPVGSPSIAIDMTRWEHPLLLSGLALAGANHRASALATQEDGILTAEEIAWMDLSGVDWAVLSACDTGLGAIKSGEGVLGLRRAFQTAGVRTVVMSLWQVADDSTRVWMRTLYERKFAARQTSADAMRDAARQILRGRRDRGLNTHPFFWAGFVAVGDWR